MLSSLKCFTICDIALFFPMDLWAILTLPVSSSVTTGLRFANSPIPAAALVSLPPLYKFSRVSSAAYILVRFFRLLSVSTISVADLPSFLNFTAV